MDDYFKNMNDAPKDEKGNPDLECLGALRIDDFNNELKILLNGGKTKRCTFNFIKGTHSYSLLIDIFLAFFCQII